MLDFSDFLLARNLKPTKNLDPYFHKKVLKIGLFRFFEKRFI